MEDTTSFLYMPSRVYDMPVIRPKLKSEAAMCMRYVCDACKQSFEGSEIILKPFGNNFNCVGTVVMLVEDESVVVGCGNTTTLDRDSHEYFTMHCPRCGEVHLFGFDLEE